MTFGIGWVAAVLQGDLRSDGVRRGRETHAQREPRTQQSRLPERRDDCDGSFDCAEWSG